MKNRLNAVILMLMTCLPFVTRSAIVLGSSNSYALSMGNNSNSISLQAGSGILVLAIFENTGNNGPTSHPSAVSLDTVGSLTSYGQWNPSDVSESQTALNASIWATSTFTATAGNYTLNINDLNSGGQVAFYQLFNAEVSNPLNTGVDYNGNPISLTGLDAGSAIVDIGLNGQNTPGSKHNSDSPAASYALTATGNRGFNSGLYLNQSGNANAGYTNNGAGVAGALVVNVIPEPGTLALTGLAFITLLAFARKRR